MIDRVKNPYDPSPHESKSVDAPGWAPRIALFFLAITLFAITVFCASTLKDYLARIGEPNAYQLLGGVFMITVFFLPLFIVFAYLSVKYWENVSVFERLLIFTITVLYFTPSIAGCVYG